MRDRYLYLIILALIIVAPLFLRSIIVTEILIFSLVAVANNLMLGFTGMLSFGQATFFGVGAYAAGLLAVHFQLPLFLILPIVFIGVGAFTAVIGYFCVRRVGLYFIMLTFAFNQMFYFIAYSWTTLTGGEDGLPGVHRPALLTDDVPFYIFVVVLFFVALFLMKRIIDSPLGRLFQAVRDNPGRAEATGHNVPMIKLMCFTIAGAFTGLAGGVYAFLFQYVPIDAIHWLTSGDIVFMTLIGGSGSFFGPLLGAAFFIWLRETVSIFWDRWPLIVGVTFALVVLYLRGGLVDIIRYLFGRLMARRQASG
jgi:branched-chain amino acid transport system permease protein